MQYKCVSSFYYNQTYWIYKYLNSKSISYKFDCNIHPEEGFQLFVLEDYIDKVRRDLWFIEQHLLMYKDE